MNIGFFLQLPDRLDGLGDAGVVEGGVGAPVEGLGISLPLANVTVAKKMKHFFRIQNIQFALPVDDTRGTAKSLSIDRDALLDLDGVGGGDALHDVTLLRRLGAPGCRMSCRNLEKVKVDTYVVVMTSWQRSVMVVSSNTSTTVWQT